MKKLIFLHVGFEKPTPEIMAAWGKWFESIADKQVDQGGFSGGREISRNGTKDLPWASRSPVTTSSKPKTAPRQKRSHKAIHSSQASGSMKSGRCNAQSS